MKKIKILQIVPSLSQSNGVAAFVCNYFEAMDKKNIDVTFLVLNAKSKERYKVINENGGHIIELYRERNLFKYFIKVNKLFSENKFDIVHCHVPNYGAIFLLFAKLNKVKVRILHSHVNKSADRLFQRIRNNIISPIAVNSANEFFACSKAAGDFLFKNKHFTVINNAIDLKKYQYSSIIRQQYRKKLNIKNEFVIGEFGRLCPQKNQLFAIDIFHEILKQNKNCILILAGNGFLEQKIVKKLNDYNIADKVKLLGSREDLDKLYNSLDAFLLPSTYEGLGIVLIEAQANGLNCFTSKDYVPQTAHVSSLLHYIKLNNNSKEWADKILEHINDQRKNVSNEIEKAGYNIAKEANILLNEYVKLYNKYGDGSC